jgi:hypothetical protein
MQMNAKLVVFVLSVLMCASGVIVGGASMNAMLQEVNRTKAGGERLPAAWWGPTTRLRLLKEYQRLFPDGPQLRNYLASGVLIAAGLVGVAASLGIIG